MLARSGRLPYYSPPPKRTITRPKTAPKSRPTMNRSRSVQVKTFYISGNQVFNCGHSEAIGRRPTMEDALACYGEFLGPGTQYYAVFDGHGGKEVSRYCAEHLHNTIAENYRPGCDFQAVVQKAITQANENVVNRYEYAGTTAAIAIIIEDMIFTANVGDSRIILIDNGRAYRKSFDHKATVANERKQIIKKGGTVFQGRVNGILMLSRAIGDGTLSQYISCQAYQTVTPRTDNLKMILACDGVWDVMSDQNAADIFCRAASPLEAARLIKSEALRRGSTDNVSVICVDLGNKIFKDEFEV